MSSIRRYPVLAVLVVAGTLAGVGAGLAAAGSTPSLPAIGTDELVSSTLAAIARDPDVSGQLLSHVDLGLPSFPAQAPRSLQGIGSVVEAVNGDHRIRYWRSAGGVRVSELLPTAELSFVARREGGVAEAWAWDSRSFTAWHAGPALLPGEMPPSPAAGFDPMPATRQLLAAVGPTTAVSLAPSTRVAGRDAYVLRIEPRDAGTLVGSIEISVDAARRVPLRVAAFARGAADPALSLGFTSIRFAPVDPAVFRFQPPPGARVGRVRLPSQDQGAGVRGQRDGAPGAGRFFGSAWSTVAAYPIPAGAIASAASSGLGAFLPFSGSLFSVRLVDRPAGSWLLVGAVPQSRLAAVENLLP